MAYKLRLRWQGKCPRHPRYVPDKHGESGIRGDCKLCRFLLDAHEAAQRLKRGLAEFDRRALGAAETADQPPAPPLVQLAEGREPTCKDCGGVGEVPLTRRGVDTGEWVCFACADKRCAAAQASE